MNQDTLWEKIEITFQDTTGFETVVSEEVKSFAEVIKQHGNPAGDFLTQIKLINPII